MRTRRYLIKVLPLFAVFGLSLMASKSDWFGAIPLRLRTPWHVVTPTLASKETEGPELALIFIDSPTCVWCNAPELPGLVGEARQKVREQAQSRGYGFASVGLSRTASVEAGIDHLSRFGAFDEVSVGRRWYNMGLLKFVYGTFVGPAATPQLIVVERIVAPSSAPGFQNERVLLRQIGLGPIQEWVARGAPVPQTADRAQP